MNKLICPISNQTINQSVVRITALLVALSVIVYAFTHSFILLTILLIDFIIRAFSLLPYSPLSFIAFHISKMLHLTPHKIDQAPKLFAARVGFLFALSMLVVFFMNPFASLIIGLVLMSFALLEALFNFCVGCIVYTYVILPLNKSVS